MWIAVKEQNEIPLNVNIIVEDDNGWTGYAHYDPEEKKWYLETFGQVKYRIEFAEIVRYLVIPE